MEEVKCQCNSGTVDVETQGNFSKLFEDLFGVWAMPAQMICESLHSKVYSMAISEWKRMDVVKAYSPLMIKFS